MTDRPDIVNPHAERLRRIETGGLLKNLCLHNAANEIDRLLAANAALEVALKRISAIPNSMSGGDWCEIEEARAIADAALSAQPGEGEL